MHHTNFTAEDIEGERNEAACPSQQVWVELRFEQINTGLGLKERLSMATWLF